MIGARDRSHDRVGDDVLQAGDHVVVVGDRENVRNLALLAEGV